MSFEWKTYRLCEAGKILTGKTPKGGVSDFVGEEVPFITPPDFSGEKWINQSTRSISELGAQSVKGSIIPARAVLITCIGSDMGKVAITPSRCVANQQINAIIVDESKFSPEFLYYSFRLRKEEIRNLAGGSAQPILNKSTFGQISFAAPDLNGQSQIVDVLNPFDDYIRLLRETNKTLESIAQTIFKSWFVDFDPVRAKMEGRQPEGMDEETAALFPSQFEASKLGDLPKNWKVGNFGEILILRSERIKSGTITDSLPYVPIESITAMNPFLENFKAGDEAKSSLVRFYKGDILFGAMRPYFHKVSIAPFDGVTRTTVFVLSPKVEVARAYALFLAFDDSTVKYATHHSEGSTIPYARWKGSFELMPVVVPPEKVLKKFDHLISAVIESAELNIKRIRGLENIRNLLLPKLIAGQLRISDMAQVEENAEM
ncbi:restriction endonuclease subunit S [Advenella sp. FME57]|uniref:restriction endonuclease subunit S n=1 Tax=Advenella sp. FME57 TaxID=2742604 RepID=UPI00186737F0|nr:restriction endonuclease subunit S [Advenella sp. FME57]